MNINILKLVESLFDSNDNIFDNEDNIVSDLIIKDLLSSLSKEYKGNKTIYPNSFDNIELAKQYALLASGLINELSNGVYSYEFICEFKDYDNNLLYDCITIIRLGNMYVINSNPHTAVKIYLDNYHIYSILLINTYYDYYLKNKMLHLYIYNLIQYIFNNHPNYTIDEILIGDDKINGNDYKEISLGSYDNHGITFSTDMINKLPILKIHTDKGYKEVKTVFKNKILLINYLIKVKDKESLISLLTYFHKELLFNKIRMDHIILLENINDKKDYSTVRNIFTNFCIQYNIQQYSFTLKKDIGTHIIDDICIPYIKDNFNVSIQFYNFEFIDKGNDKDGLYLLFNAKLEGENSEDNSWVYFKCLYKFYKTGLCDLIELTKNGKTIDIKK